MDVQEKKIEYLQHCVSENLNHARHVENERLSFTSIYTAIVVGSVAVLFALEDSKVALGLALFLAAVSILATRLNNRWQEVFDEHIDKAKACDEQWRNAIAQSATGYLFADYGAGKQKEQHEGRTKQIFSLLYRAILVAVLMLVAYFCYRVFTGENHSLIFSNESVEALEEFLNKGEQKPLVFAEEEIKEILINLKRVDYLNRIKEGLYQQATEKNEIVYYYLDKDE